MRTEGCGLSHVLADRLHVPSNSTRTNLLCLSGTVREGVVSLSVNVLLRQPFDGPVRTYVGKSFGQNCAIVNEAMYSAFILDVDRREICPAVPNVVLMCKWKEISGDLPKVPLDVLRYVSAVLNLLKCGERFI